MKRLDTVVFKTYKQMVEKAYPAEVENWPVLSGYHLGFGEYRGWKILLFEHTGNPIPLKIPLEPLTAAVVGVDDIGSDIELARKNIARHLHLSINDMLVLLNPRASNLEEELDVAFKRHEALYKKKAELDHKNEIPIPRPLKETGEQKKEDEHVKSQYIQTVEHAAVIVELPQAEIKKELETEEQQKAGAVKQEDAEAKLQPSKNKVLIIHSDNEKIKKSLRNFLLSLGLQAVEWAEALLMAEKPDPDHIDVLRVAFEQCQAVVFVLTNDRQDVSFPDEGQGLKVLPQSELNALFMSGMAAAIDRHRTVIASLGNPEPFQGIPGLHITSLDNTLEKRKDFIKRLRDVECEIKTKGKAWQISGDFDIDLKPVFAEKRSSIKPVDIEPVKKTLAPVIQTETARLKTVGQTDKDTTLEQPPADSDTSMKNEPEQPPRNRLLIDSLPLINILKIKKPLKSGKPAPENNAQPQTRKKAETVYSDIKTTEPAAKKPPQKGKSPFPTAQQPEPEIQPEKDKRPVTSLETGLELKKPQKPIKGTAPKKDDDIHADEKKFIDRIKELEGKLEALKNRGGRINQRAVDDLEKQIQSEKYRLRTIQQLANIEKIKKSYE